MKNIAKNVAAALGMDKRGEQKFDKDFHPPVLRLNFKWSLIEYDSDFTLKKKNEKVLQTGAFYFDVVGTHYIQDSKTRFEITEWDTKGKIRIPKGSKKPDPDLEKDIDSVMDEMCEYGIRDPFTNGGRVNMGLGMEYENGVWEINENINDLSDEFELDEKEMIVIEMTTEVIEYKSAKKKKLDKSDNTPTPC